MMVKICGITRVEDAEAAVRYGASAVGFVFWTESPRFIDPYRARRIVSTLPPFVIPVGVFVDQPIAYVNGVAALARLGAVQLHGDEDAAYASQVTRPVIKTVSDNRASTGDWPERVMLLVDARDPVRRGGTGQQADWSFAGELAATRRILLAGGLTPETIAQAVGRVRPFGVDVSSGVEVAPGVKDPARIRALFDALAAETRTSAAASGKSVGRL